MRNTACAHMKATPPRLSMPTLLRLNLIAVFAVLLWVCIPITLHADSGKIYEALDKLIKDTPVESMSIDWLTKEVYQKFPEPQKMLKKILGQSGMAPKNEKMGRLRQAIDLEFWIHVAKVKGWTPELTNQGKANGHRSDHDQTGWALVGPEGDLVNRKRAFQEVREMWSDWLRTKHGITPEKPDMTIFDGDAFLPDWTNAKMGSQEHIRELSKQLLELRKNGEAYFAPGANRTQVVNRALQEGRTMHIAWYNGVPYINGEPFDLEKFIRGELTIKYLPAREIAARYRGVQKQPPWRLALGNAAENLRRYLTHLEQAIDRQKYGNRIVDEAFAPITAVAYKEPGTRPVTYSEIHGSKHVDANKLDFKKKFIQQIYMLDAVKDAQRINEIMDLFDRSANIELDKKNNKPYSASEYFGKELKELGIGPERATAEELKKAEELFVQRHMEVLLDGVSTVLKNAMHEDMTPEGRKRNRSQYGKNHREGLRKLFFEGRVEIAALFEAIMSIKDEKLREKHRNKLIESAPTPGLRRMLERMDNLAKAEAIDDFLREAAKTGKVPRPEEVIAEKERRTRKAVADPEAMAKKVPDEKARQRARELVARSLGPEQAANYKKVMEILRQGATIVGAGGKEYLREMYEGFDYLALTSTALNLIQTYQVECSLGGKTGWDCQQAILTQGMHEALWFLPKVNELMLIFTSLKSINEGDKEGFFTLGLGAAAHFGYPAGMHLYFIYNIGVTGVNVTYGYAIAVSQDDMVTQAFRSFPQPGKPAMRSGERGSIITSDTPDAPIMWEVDVQANQWDTAKRSAEAKKQFRTAIWKELIRRGLTPDTTAWDQAYQEQLSQYAFDLPYYQRMAKAYEYFGPQIKRYIDDARNRGLDLFENSFDVMDICLEQSNNKNAEESPLPKCLAKAIESSTPVLDAFFNKHLEQWLDKQRDGYKTEFYSTMDTVMGRDTYRQEVFSKLKAVLKREYMLSQYMTLKNEQGVLELERRAREVRDLIKKMEMLAKAVIAGKEEASEEFSKEYVDASAQLYEQPVQSIKPEITLNVPEWAVRLGESAPVEVEVRGEQHSDQDETSAKNIWVVEYDFETIGIQEGKPPGLIMTSELEKEMQKRDGGETKFFTITDRVKTIVRNKAGETLGSKEGTINWFDIRFVPKPAEEMRPEDKGAEEVIKGASETKDKITGISGRATATAGQIDFLCKSAREKAEKAKQELETLKKEIDKVKNKIKGLKEKLAKLSEKVQRANTHKDEAYKAGEKVAEAKQKMETLLSQLCKNADAVKSADSGNVPRLLSEIDKANEAIGKLRQEAEREARRSKDEARKAEALDNETKATPAEIEDLKVTISGLQGRLESVQKATRETREAAGKAKEKVSELESIYGEAAALLKDAKKKLEPIKETDKAKEATKSMEGAVGMIAPAVEKARKCPEEFKTTLESLDKALSGIEGDFKSGKAEIEAMALPATVQNSIAKIQDFAKKAKESADAAEVYLTWVEKYGIDAAQCVRTAKENATKASDKSLNDAKATLAACEFERARVLIDQMSQGKKKTEFEKEYRASIKHEDALRAMVGDANSQYISCNFDKALPILKSALSKAKCQKHIESIKEKISNVQGAREIEENNKALMRDAEGKQKSCSYNEALAMLNEARSKATCNKRIEQINGRIAALKKDMDKAECRCKPGYKWDGKICAPTRETLVKNHDCSMIANSYAGWDEGSNQPLCFCKPGYEWNSTKTACVSVAERQRGQREMERWQAECARLSAEVAEMESLYNDHETGERLMRAITLPNSNILMYDRIKSLDREIKRRPKDHPEARPLTVEYIALRDQFIVRMNQLIPREADLSRRGIRDYYALLARSKRWPSVEARYPLAKAERDRACEKAAAYSRRSFQAN